MVLECYGSNEVPYYHRDKMRNGPYVQNTLDAILLSATILLKSLGSLSLTLWKPNKTTSLMFPQKMMLLWDP